MIRYSEEQKGQALESINQIGVSKTASALNIPRQTLYKWKAEDSSSMKKASPKARKASKKKAVPASEPINEESVSDATITPISDAPVCEDSPAPDSPAVLTLLSCDDLLEKIKQLEEENRLLRESNVKLKKIVATWIA